MSRSRQAKHAKGQAPIDAAPAAPTQGEPAPEPAVAAETSVEASAGESTAAGKAVPAAGKPPKKQRSFGKRIARALPYVGLVVGLLIIAYFPAVELYDAWERANVALDVDEAVSDADAEEIAYLLAQAEAYNLRLAGLEADIADEDILDYEDQLSLTGHDTAFGYVIIPSLSLTMPIYHGTSDAVLSAGAGHWEYSSLPVGGESTHAVITAHSGLSGMRAFDDLDELEVGDVFGVKVLGQLICYEVVSVEVVLPDEVDSLAIVEGEDLCTLVTCTPYGVNDHRLLVTGVRCEVPDGFLDDSSDSAVASAVASVAASGRLWPFVVAFLAVLALLIALAVSSSRRKRRRAKAQAAAAEAPAGAVAEAQAPGGGSGGSGGRHARDG